MADYAAPIMAFLLYTNAAVVAVHFHGVPFIVAASYPLVLFAPLARDVLLRGLPLVVTPALLWILGLFAVAVVGALVSVRPEESVETLQEYALEGILIYVLVTNAIRTPTVLQAVVRTLLLGGFLMGALVAFQQFSGSYDNEFFGFAQLDREGKGFLLNDTADAGRQRRLAGPLGMPNRFAQIMAVLVPLALFQLRSARRPLARFLAGTALLGILLGGALAFSRGAAVGLALMLLAMAVMGYVRIGHLVGVAVAGALVVMLLVPQYGRRLVSLAEVAELATQSDGVGLGNADGSTRGRLTEMITAVLVFADHAVIGVGPGMYPEHYIDYARIAGGKVRPGQRQAHSMPLQIAAEHGLLGLGAFGMALLVTFRDLERTRRRWLQIRPDLADLQAGLILALIVYMATALFLHMSYARYFWFLLAVTGAASRMTADEESSILGRLVSGPRVIASRRPATAAGRAPA